MRVRFSLPAQIFKYVVLVVSADDEKRRRVYEKVLIPLGFKVTKDQYKNLYIRI